MLQMVLPRCVVAGPRGTQERASSAWAFPRGLRIRRGALANPDPAPAGSSASSRRDDPVPDAHDYAERREYDEGGILEAVGGWFSPTEPGLPSDDCSRRGMPQLATEGNVPEQPPGVSPEDGASRPYVRPGTAVGEAPRPQQHLSVRVRQFIRAVRDSDRAAVEEAVVRLSHSRRWLAPLALAVGALTMLFDGVKLLFTNWRLSLVQVLPAMWIWAAMLDLKAHVLHGKSFHVLTGPVVIPIVLAVAVITAASFFLNAVFGFAIASEGPPAIRPAVAQARAHLAVVLGWGAAVGICLGLATVVFVRWGLLWFGLALSIVVAVMMVCYVAVPARLIGVKTTSSKRDKLTATAVGGAIGAVVCTPPYVLGRVGLLMIGSHTLFIVGCVVLAIGLTLQAGATGAVKAVKMSAKLVSGNRGVAGDDSPPEQTVGLEQA